MNDDHALLRLVIPRRGIFTRTEARSLGFTDRAIEYRLETGRWRALTSSVLVVDGFEGSWEQRAFAATAIHPAAALSHQSSATWLGLDGFRPGRLHICVPPCGAHASALAVVHRSRHHQFEVRNGIRTTTFAQTMVQLAGTVDDRTLRAALHSGIHADHRRIELLRTRLGELAGRRMPGLGRVIDALDEIDGEPPTESELERRLFEVLGRVPGIGEIRRQVPFSWGDRCGRTDGYVPEWFLIVEADGRRWHTRVADFEADRWRDAEAAAHGLYVMRFTWHRLQHDSDGVVDQVTRFAAARRRAA